MHCRRILQSECRESNSRVAERVKSLVLPLSHASLSPSLSFSLSLSLSSSLFTATLPHTTRAWADTRAHSSSSPRANRPAARVMSIHGRGRDDARRRRGVINPRHHPLRRRHSPPTRAQCLRAHRLSTNLLVIRQPEHVPAQERGTDVVLLGNLRRQMLLASLASFAPRPPAAALRRPGSGDGSLLLLTLPADEPTE